MSSVSSDSINYWQRVPVEVQAKVIGHCFLADIFEVMRVSHHFYHVGKLGFIEKNRSLGYQRSVTLGNYEDAKDYFQRFFFKMTPESSGGFLFSTCRSAKEMRKNEEEILHLPVTTWEEKLQFVSCLDTSTKDEAADLFQGLGAFSSPEQYFEVKQEHVGYFLKQYFDITLPEAAYKLSFKIDPQTAFTKFEILLFLGAFLSNTPELLEKLLKRIGDRAIDFNAELTNRIGENRHYEFYHQIFNESKDNLLHMAAYLGHVEVVKCMKKKTTGESLKYCMDQENCIGNTPLDVALLQGNTNFIKCLRNSFREMRLKPRLQSLVHYLLKTNDAIIFTTFMKHMKYLEVLENVPVVASVLIDQSNKHYIGHPIFQLGINQHRAIYLKEAVKAGCIKLINLWVDQGSINQLDSMNRTLLEIASADKNYQVIPCLILNGHSLDDIKSIRIILETLANDSSKEALKAIQAFIRAGVDVVSLKLDQTCKYAEYLTYVKVTQVLLRDNNVESLNSFMKDSPQDSFIDAVIGFALKGSKIALQLVQEGIIRFNIKEKTIYKAPLYSIICDMDRAQCDFSRLDQKRKELIRRWIPEKKYEKITHSSMTLLTFAAKAEFKELFPLFVERKWDIDQKDKHGWAPIHYSIKSRNITFFRFLLDLGSRIDMDLIQFAHTNHAHNCAKILSVRQSELH